MNECNCTDFKTCGTDSGMTMDRRNNVSKFYKKKNSNYFSYQTSFV
jgi:hypothetical protein